MTLPSFFSAVGPDMFSRAVPATTNPNARPAKKGKTAKSKRRRMREAQQQQAGFANQQQMQKDQFDFLKQNIFDRTGATRRTIGGQIEQPGPQGMDYFTNTGPDRESVAKRKAALDATSLSQPDAWTNAQAAVNRQKQVQGWADPNTPPPQAPSNFNQDQYMKTPGKFMDVFSNGDGTVTRSRANPYGSARSVYSPSVQGPPKPSAPAVNPGPISNLFQGGFQNYNQAVNDALQETAPQNTVPYRPINDAQAVFTPQAGLTPPSPMNEAPSMGPPVQPPSYTGISGIPSIGWNDLVPQENSAPLFDMFVTDPATGKSNFDWKKLQSLFTPAQPQASSPAKPFYPLGF